MIPALDLRLPAELLLQRLLKVVLVLVVFVVLWRLVTASDQLLSASLWARMNPASRSLVPLGARIVKVMVVAIGFVAILAELGYPVASLVAGLGLGGLAFALAAQKTVENLFGAFSIGVDQPFREGDFVRIEDVMGTVEAIGLRSTRVRTLDRTVVSLPNGKLADTRVETFAARDRIRLSTVVSLDLGTSAAQVRQVLAAFERLLSEHPRIWPGPTVRLRAFGESALELEVTAWFDTADWNEFTILRQDVLLGFMQAVEAAGARLARPARTVELVGAPAADTPQRRAQG